MAKGRLNQQQPCGFITPYWRIRAQNEFGIDLFKASERIGGTNLSPNEVSSDEVRQMKFRQIKNVLAKKKPNIVLQK